MGESGCTCGRGRTTAGLHTRACPRRRNGLDERLRRGARELRVGGGHAERVRAITDRLRAGLIDWWLVAAAADLGDTAAQDVTEGGVRVRHLGGYFSKLDRQTGRGDVVSFFGDEDYEQAESEGWGFFESDSYGLEIERDDEAADGPGPRPPSGTNDDDFSEWLAGRAANGDRFAIRALVHLKQNNFDAYTWTLLTDSLYPGMVKRRVFARMRRGKERAAVRAMVDAKELEIVDGFLFGGVA